MSKRLFISNTTRQNLIFQVRWPGDHSGKLFARQIASGRQIEITERELGADPQPKWKAIEEHLDRMGARDTAELHQSQIEDYLGITYRWDAQISETEIVTGHEMVMENADRRAAEEALKAAAGAHIAINGDQRIQAKTTAVEVIQDYDPRKGPDDQAIKFSATVDPVAGQQVGKLKRRA